MPETLTIAAVQMNSQNYVTANLAVVQKRVQEAHAAGAQWVVLPEGFAFMGGSDHERREVAESFSGDGPIVNTLRSLAKEYQLTLVGGGMAEISSDLMRPYNTCVVISPQGEVVARYRKIHLFDADVADGQNYHESATTTPGDTPVVVNAGSFKIGLSICYDVRFPELYRDMVSLGANVFLIPSAFTLMTGKDHWHVLLRARALENTAYVVAAAQWGKHPKGRMTYGKSLAIDPWGEVIAQASEGEGIVYATLNAAYLEDVRKRLAVRPPCGILARACRPLRSRWSLSPQTPQRPAQCYVAKG